VAAGSRYLEAAFGVPLPLHHLEIRARHCILSCRPFIFLPVHQQVDVVFPLKDAEHIGEAPHAIKPDSFYVYGFLCRFVWKNTAFETVVAGIDSNGQGAANIPYRTVESKFSEKQMGFQALRLCFGDGTDKRHGNCKVERRTLLLDVRRGQIDDDSLAGDAISIASDGSENPCQAFTHGTVGKADQLDADSGGNVGFNRDCNNCQAETGCTISLAQHIVFSAKLYRLQADKKRKNDTANDFSDYGINNAILKNYAKS
jgi:hypothetical protein